MHRKEFEETFINSGSLVNMTKDEALRLLGKEVAMMIGYNQNNPHHCYDLWEHSIKTMQGLTCDKDNQLRVAAFFHDIGKPSVARVKDGRTVYYGHAQKSVEIANSLLNRLGYMSHEIEQILFYIEHHDDFISCKVVKLPYWKDLMWRKTVGKNVVFNRNYLVYKAAWWTLAMRVIWGIPYSIGVLPLPIALPFAGRIGFYMDTIALGLLIWSVIESKCIDESFYADKRVSDIFEGAEIKLMDWDEDNVFKIVLTCAEEATVICFAEEYKEHNVMVLRPIDLDETCVLIVEKSADTDLWHDVEDDTVRSEILQKYMENNRPDCMEVVE